jgi:hypothetical protein
MQTPCSEGIDRTAIINDVPPMSDTPMLDNDLKDDSLTVADDSAAQERRKRNIPVAVDRRRQNAAAARRSSERRRLIDPTTCERDYSEEEMEFMRAMERYKRENRRPFPTWSEVLEVMISLGYRRVETPTDLPGVKREAPPKG